VAVPLSAVTPARALSFFEIIVVPHASPAHVATPTPSAIVASGSTPVSAIVTGPSVETAKGLPVVASCPTVPENVSVVVTGVGAVVAGEIPDAHALVNKNNVRTNDGDLKWRMAGHSAQDTFHALFRRVRDILRA
jgi:hypothetical protein